MYRNPRWRLCTYESKWDSTHPSYAEIAPVCPADASPEIIARLSGITLDCARIFGLTGYARVDFRMNSDGELFVLEVNPNPDISPDAGMTRAARAAGLSYPDLILEILRLGPPWGRGDAHPRHRTGGPRGDPGLIAGTGAFKPFEVDVAMELVDVALTRKEQDDYHPYVLVEDDGTVVAYACFGKNAMTTGTFDLYWIATRTDRMGKGYGRAILSFVEEEVRRRGGTSW